MKTVDFHAHPVPESFRKWLPQFGVDVIADDGFPPPKWTVGAHLEAHYVPHPLAGVMAQNSPVNAKEKHVWSTGNQKI